MTGVALLVGVLVAVGVGLWPAGRVTGTDEPGAGPPDRRAWAAARPVLARLRRPSPPGWRRGGGEDWVADLAEVVAVGLRAGLDLRSAVRTGAASPSVAAAAPWLARALEEPGASTPASSVLLDRPPGADGGEALDVLSRAWRLSERTGASAAHTTAAAAAAVRGRAEARHRLAVALAGPRASMRLLTLLPLAGPGAGLLLGLDPARLYGPAPARLAVGCGLALTLLGWWWSAALVRRACRPGTTAG